MGFTAFRSASVLNFERFFSGIGENIILMSTQKLNEQTIKKYNQDNIQSSFDGERIAFSENDNMMVKNIDGVDSVVLLNEGISTDYNKNLNHLKLQFSSQSYSSSIKQYNYGSDKISSFSFKIKKMNIPNKYVKDYNPDQLNLIVGNYPKDDTTEILVPDVFILQNYDTEQFSKLIGKTITLNMISNTTKKLVKEKMKIVGVYQTSYQNRLQSEYTIYTGYFEESDLQYFLTKESYEHYKMVLSMTPESSKASQAIIASYEDYVNAVGTSKDQMLIKVNGDIKKVSDELERLFPKYQLTSQYEIQTGYFGTIYKKLLLVLIVGSIIISLIFGLIIVFLNRGHIDNCSKELAILYSLGYSKKYIFLMIFLENMLQFMISFIGAVVVALLANKFYFSKSLYFTYFTSLHTFANLFFIFLLVL